MTEFDLNALTHVEVSLKVIRADGTVEDLGVVAEYDKKDKVPAESDTWLERLHQRIQKGGSD